MGAWGIKNLENDTALDWLESLSSFITDKDIEPYLDKVLQEKEFIDDEESFISLAIAELMLHQLGTRKIEGLADRKININFSISQIEKGIKVINKILYFEEHSELRELWQESEDYESWEKYQLSIVSHLQKYLNEKAPYKSYQGKSYTKSEWIAFEQGQWENYSKNRKS
ncbi:DUF4259 domain-containing protein [Flavobacterium oreochromis]|uniref:DUF4259 domain-containing protein n=2 Tax=Flavobacterium TaxID=237 RepID=A0A246GED0_9FLAO|nr:DUF4259 domain-containing protein [Flavobacterium oreochromis]OWP79039.1 hypothetical protein BWG23_00405 [Flavobacterium oreochromis]OWP79745.1 hypothetical protein BWK62_00465 [Flavobacterium oreochromis]POR30815.1 hypothetical protein BWK58_00515 [Flavobacterium columnare]